MNTESEHDLDRPLADFLGHLRVISKTVSIVIPALYKWRSEEITKLRSSENELENEIKNGSGNRQELHSKIKSHNRKASDFNSIDHRAVIVESAFTQLFSRFDAFTGDLLNTIYKKNSNLFLSGEKSITLSEVRKFRTADEILHNELLAEIENFRRKSYGEQFSILETKFGLKLKEFAEWPEFIEASQRRNLIIHNNGVVNAQYITVCQSARKPGQDTQSLADYPKIGEKLIVNIKYFRAILRLIKNVAFMLTHTLWRKLFREEIAKSHTACNLVIYDYLCREEWPTAVMFGSFALAKQMREDIDDKALKMRIINYAIALKFSGNERECKKQLENVDWTSANRDFRLAVAVLSDSNVEAFDLMRKIGREGDLIDESAYRDWPLFFRLKQTSEFVTVFEEIYNKKFIPQVVDINSTSSDQPQILAPESSPIGSESPQETTAASVAQ